MKNRLILVMLLLSHFAYTQVLVNEVNINELKDVKYIQLLATQKGFSTKIVISVDYGQPRKLFKSQRIKGLEGKNKAFNSVIDALNFMEKNGWAYVNSYVATESGSNEYHYLLKRKEEKKK